MSLTAKQIKKLEQIIQQAKEILQLAKTRCLIPGFDGATLSAQWKDALWGGV